MKTLVRIEGKKAPRKSVVSQEQKLKNGLGVSDLSQVRFQGFFDCASDVCACGHKIMYRFHTSHGVVGSECIKYFTGDTKMSMMQADKMLKKKMRDEKKKIINSLKNECFLLYRQIEKIDKLRASKAFDSLFSPRLKDKGALEYRKIKLQEILNSLQTIGETHEN